MSRVGENIDAHCLKCKLVLAHIVMYEVSGVVSKVKCKTCGAEHKYRGVKPPPKRDASGRAAKEKKAKAAVTSRGLNSQAPLQWAAKQEGMAPGTTIKDYSMKEQYQVNDVIRHPSFGLGFVEQIVSEKRMEVLFQDAVKSMAMNITSP